MNIGFVDCWWKSLLILSLFFRLFCVDISRLALKVVVTSTAVYWTNQLEVWSALSSKERAYDQIISCAKQYITKNTPDSLKLQVNSHAMHCMHAITFNNHAWQSNVFDLQNIYIFYRFEKFKTINYCFLPQSINTTIKVWWAHSVPYRICHPQFVACIIKHFNSWILHQRQRQQQQKPKNHNTLSSPLL